MRFLPSGLNIPDELLEERDKGNVVFLCGAGVSYPAGMPDFLELAKYVVEELGTPQDAPSRKMLSMWDDGDIPEDARPSLDQIFNLLQQEYAPGEIDYLIAKRLKTKPRTCVSTHETILRLSKGADGTPQIVTTNFDLLFERATGRRLKTYVPPALPDLANGQPLNGLVYLHGRINSRTKRGEARQGFVVSSSDFGRAYLAEGWATRFIRDLLDQYTVILLGYSANDPPVRYLLQGLHTQRRGSRARLFAFDSGTEEEVQPRWRDSGVRALAYPATDSHSALWDTLSAWADRADDPLAWRKQIVDLARKGPRNLEPYERGQVASLVRTDVGAKLFADADPLPPGEWLCVFDHNFRYGEVGTQSDDSQPAFDPFTEYSLDDDPPRPPENGRRTDPPGDDLLSLKPTEKPTDHRINDDTRLAKDSRQWTEPLSFRLFDLIQWIAKTAHEPVVPWWAARYSSLYPKLLDEIEWRVERAVDELPCLARLTWRLLIEKFHTAPDDPYGLRVSWDEMRRRIETEGWTNSFLREFERNVTPYIETEQPLRLDAARPPDKDWSQIHLDDIARFKVAFPIPVGERPEIPDDVLPKVYQIVRRHLELAAGLLTDIGTSYWKTSTFYPEDRSGRNYISGESPCSYLFWFRGLFNQMVKAHPELVGADVALWPKEDTFFFNKLHLYAWTFDVLFSGDEVGDGLLSLSDEAFWEENYRRELLHLLKCRWHELPSDKRELVERRLVNGRARYGGESEEDFEQRRSIESAMVLGWLINQGCELGEETLDVLPDLRRADPRWCPEWDEAADESRDSRVVSIETDSDPSLIIDAPISQIIPLTMQHTTGHTFPELTVYSRFDGLVEQRPVRAVAVLTHAARQGEYPAQFWRSTLQKWPDEARHRLSWLFGARLARLPSETVIELGYEVFCWLRKHLSKLAAQDQPRALSIFDTLLEKLFIGAAEVGQSGEHRDRSRRTLNYAINTPIGNATDLLLDLLNSQGPEKGSGVPPEIKSRLERLFDAPGEGADHAVCIAAHRLRWLDYIDPEWGRTTIVPWFDLEHPASESAWNGFLYDNQRPKPELFSLIKSDFLKAIVHVAGRKRLHKFLVLGCFWHQDNDAYITFEETRQVLQKTNASGRAHSLWFFTRIVDKNHAWRRFGKPFLEKAWPKEARFQTEQTSQHLVELAERASDFFPEVVQTIRPYLVPLSQNVGFVYSLVRQNDDQTGGLPTQFPDATLMLIDKIIPDDPDQVPYDLDLLIEMIAEAKSSLRQDSRWRRLKALALHE